MYMRPAVREGEIAPGPTFAETIDGGAVKTNNHHALGDDL